MMDCVVSDAGEHVTDDMIVSRNRESYLVATSQSAQVPLSCGEVSQSFHWENFQIPNSMEGLSERAHLRGFRPIINFLTNPSS